MCLPRRPSIGRRAEPRRAAPLGVPSAAQRGGLAGSSRWPRSRVGRASGFRCAVAVAVAMVAIGVRGSAFAATSGATCDRGAADSLRACVARLGRVEQTCVKSTGLPCAASDAGRASVLAAIAPRIATACPDRPSVEAAGHGSLMTPEGLVERLASACTHAVASLVARSWGGPHAAARAKASSAERRCLDGAFRDGLAFVGWSAKRQGDCIRDAASGRGCSTSALAGAVAVREAATARRIDARCPTKPEALVAIDSGELARRASGQARCLVAAGHGSTAPLELDCGPRTAVEVPARGVTTKVVLPSAEWGTRCGDGSDYAFRVRLAPDGHPVENVVVHLEGGGVCIAGSDCASRPADLFEASSDEMPDAGILSSTAATNPFRDWTKVFLPYCTQDVHAGGGVASVFPEITVHRHGAVDVRAAMTWLRDAIWATLDAEDARGFRADIPRMVFGGSSAGGYGAIYNYHWVLDDLGWEHTAVLPDAAVGMDNGSAGVILLGAVANLAASPGWGSKPTRAPYCFGTECTEIVTNLERATAARLGAAPEQVILNVTNQVDEVQRSTTLFASMPDFVNTLRAGYCETLGVPGVRWFLRGRSTSIHGQVETSAWNNGVIDGVAMRDWVAGAMGDPAGLVDRVEEGALVADFPGVLPFPCAVP